MLQQSGSNSQSLVSLKVLHINPTNIYKMKKVINYFSNYQFVFKAILMLLAIVTGGGVLAIADGEEPTTKIGDEGNAPSSKEEAATEPVNPETSDRLAPGGKTEGQDLTGTQGSATQVRKGGLAEEDWESEVEKYRPFKTPLLQIIRKITKTVPCNGYEKKHARVGGETLDGMVTASIAKVEAGGTIKLTKSNFSGSMLPLYKGSTVIVPTVAGYAPGSKTKVKGRLNLLVVEKTKDEVTLQALNGPAETEGVVGETLDTMGCPAIPANTRILCGSTILSESQMNVPPENYQPRSEEVYLQKRAFSIIFTEEFEKIKKKAPHTVADMKEDALTKFLLRQERSYLYGTKLKFLMETKDGAQEYAYSAEGIINQLTNSYGIGDTYTFSDLIAIAKLMFTDFAESDEMYLFCGKNAIERLMKIELPKGRDVMFTTVKQFDITFNQFKCSYGTLNFVWDSTLDFMDLEDCMIGADFKGARHYVKEKAKEKTNDLSKDAYDPRLAKRYMHWEADCVALRGYNSILVGPEDKISTMGTSGIANNIISLSKLPETPREGMIVSLTADYIDVANDNKKYEKENLYIYKGGKWEIFSGQLVAA